MNVRALKTLAAGLAASVSLATSVLAQSASVDTIRSKEIFQQLRSFRMMATVLHVGAHPDDENTQLITALSRGRAVRTAYLSITRGDGGQNLLGPELGYKLGVARTQELLSARRVDGGQQFFTRALDFGFSKDYLETFSVWDKPAVLGDVVRVIRKFRPDVIVTVFTTVPGGTHGHHTASAVLANEAFKLAGDPTAYPEQLKQGLTVWQPKRIFSGGRGGAAGGVQMEIGGTDPVLNESFASISARSRAMHKTQGFGQPGGGGGGRAGAGAGSSRMQTFALMGGEPAKSDIFEGIDTTWARVPGGAPVESRLADLMAAFDLKDPSRSVPALLDIRKLVASLPSDPVVSEKRALLDRIIASCAGVTVLTTVPSAEVTPGQTMKLTTNITVSSKLPVTLTETRLPPSSPDLTDLAVLRNRNVPAAGLSFGWSDSLPANTPVTQPYWLREEGTAGMFRVDDPSLIGLAENPPVFPITYALAINGQEFLVPDEPVQVTSDTATLRHLKRLDVIPPASIGFATDVRIFAPASVRDVSVSVTANRPVPNATLVLDAPPGWRVVPASRPVALTKAGDSTTYKFSITAPATSTTTNIGAHVTIAGKSWSYERMTIDYPHIPIEPLQPPARFKAVVADIATRGKIITYIRGAGDDVPQALEQMGYTVKQIAAKDVTADVLKGSDAVVIGVRASNINADLGAVMPVLTTFAEQGGTVIEQYNQNGSLRNTVLGPYPLSIGGDRVTNENATVTVLAPNHPVMTTPNKITDKDFEGWVQERGIYFPNQWDPRYTPIFAMSDAGEAPLNGSLLVANVGKGYFAYTGLDFFRELPAGVPGAYRLFANLVSLGKPAAIVP